MDVRVLGPLSITRHGRDATPTARKQRQVLSLLLLNEGEVVSTDSLIREIWDLRPPRSVQTTLQTYVLQIRKHLAHAFAVPVAEIARSVLITRNGGYLLVLADANIDLRQYRSLERDGMLAFEARDDDTAVRRRSPMSRSAGSWNPRRPGSSSPGSRSWSVAWKRSCGAAGTGNCSVS
jgi:SARP family transcriptional regulator, regulator of embCAB operon